MATSLIAETSGVNEFKDGANTWVPVHRHNDYVLAFTTPAEGEPMFRWFNRPKTGVSDGTGVPPYFY